MNYLEVTDPEATRGLTRREKPDYLEFQCPACLGYGGWILKRDAYGPDQHFKCHCGQCYGWGWVHEIDAHCVHDLKEIKPSEPWRCWHTYECTKCGRQLSYDSSD